MSSDDNHLREKVGRRLTKKRKDQPRMSLDIPERLRDGDDAHDDVTAPKSRDTFNMNQSLFSMIAKAGSQADLHGRIIQEQSSESEGEGASTKRVAQSAYDSRPGGPHRTLGQPQQAQGHRRKFSDNRLLRSIPKLNIKSRKEGRSPAPAAPDETMSSSQILPPRPSQDNTERSAAPTVTSIGSRRKETLQQSGDAPSREDRQSRGAREEDGLSQSKLGTNSASLAHRLRSIFQFEELEEVICEYPCWLVQSVLLQGYMYITQKHVCFYAYVAKKSTDGGSKTGFLSKKGNRKYNRYWFMLKGDVLSYYTDPSDLYFPRNRINLSRAISASVLEHKENKDKEATEFVIESEKRTYKFIADSAASALEWVRAVQKVIFRTHNEGNSVKISLPIDNVLDVEENPLLDFAETIKIRVIDNDETYAVDEYYFSFFHSGRDALNVLKIMVDDNGLADVRNGNESPAPDAVTRKSRSHDRGKEAVRIAPSPSEPTVPVIRENVRATLSPLPPTGMRSSSPRVSMDSRRSSYDVKRRSMDAARAFSRTNSDSGRRSFSVNRSLSRGASQHPTDRTPHSPRALDSDASVSHSFDPETESSAAVQSIDDTNASASQILNRSDVFHRPTIHHSQSGLSDSDLDQLHHSQITTRSFHADKPLSSPSGYLRKSPAEPQPTTELDEDQEASHSNMQPSGSSSALQNLYQAGSYPIQKATGLAGFLRSRSTKMSRLLATESMGYYEKVSGMWAGGRKHYNPPDGLAPDDHVRGVDEDDDANVDSERFREHFALPESEELQATFFGSLQRLLPQYGKIYLSDRNFCFRTLMPTTRTKLILPLRDIENVEKEKGFRFGYHGLVITIKGHEELFFEFNKHDLRDDCAVTLLRRLESLRFMEDSSVLHKEETLREELARAEHDMLQEARQDAPPESVPQPLANDFDTGRSALIFDDPYASIVDFKPAASLNITCLTIGSRGDVQPYIALCKGLIAEGHKAKIATHAEFENAVREQGIDFAPVAGDPAELMRICVENGMFTLSFMREASDKFRGWLDGLMETAWEACQGADILIESPSAMVGIHIAEALRIPYFRAFGMPWTRTRTYPHAFGVPDHKLGGHYNQATYVVFDAVFWRAIAGQVNGFRKRVLGISGTNQTKMQANARPFLYNFSPSVVVPPLDWPDWIRVTGYWFLDGSSAYTPPADLVAFIEKARKDQKKIVYVGFGSIVVDDPAALTKTVVDSVLKADVRCILSKGWSERLGKKDASKPEVPLPAEIFQIKEAPHDWLFLQVDAAVHHGGCGTTGASLRAGIPTVIKPFFGDQFFFGIRVEDLGVGICIKKINTSVLARAMWTATNDERMLVKAKVLGEKIRRENGVQLAIQTIYRELERAKTFIKTGKDEPADESDDEWTFVEDDAEAEMEVMGHLAHFGQPNAQSSMVHSQGHGGTSSMALGSMVMRGMGGARGGVKG